MEKAFSKWFKCNEYSNDSTFLEHFNRLQEAEEGLNTQVLYSTHDNQSQDEQTQPQCEILSQTLQEVQPQSIQLQNPVQHGGYHASHGSYQLRDRKNMQQTYEGIDIMAAENSLNGTTIAGLNVETSPFAEPLISIKKKRNKFYQCPCNSYRAAHPPHPMDCGNLEYALTGKTDNLLETLPDEAHCVDIRKRLERPQFKKVKQNCLIVGWIKKASKDHSSSYDYVRSTRKWDKSLDDVNDDLLHAPSLYEDVSLDAGKCDSEALLEPPELDLDNHSLSDDINNLNFGLISTIWDIEVDTSKTNSGILESSESDPGYSSPGSADSIGNGTSFSLDRPKPRRQSMFSGSNCTDEGCCTGSYSDLDLDGGRQAYLRSRRNDLSGIQEEEEEPRDSEESTGSLEADAPSDHCDIGDYCDNNLQHNDSDFALSYCEKDDSSDDGLKLVDPRYALLAPSGTRRPSIDLAKDKEELSAPALIEILIQVARKQKEDLGKIDGHIQS
ncbi:hypothetical protein SBOR_4507 [Sclerotinia borealis F-4128]|uniref:Uncharacterized protein n=1 Tax=Sclerotinia borealis (strain F-4128) TaxID=1432307 RepID=W9CKQ3_SCLBF|nr:hypothetical protein SBOR_4507 [Sclerotinia borealis F-4128]